LNPRRARRLWDEAKERNMKGYVDNIEKATLANEDFRRVLYTGKNLQLVLMTLPPGCDIGEEVHEERARSGSTARPTGSPTISR
jgi:mannose-6-phosphate isomerase-like protein (cupin superfamily)